MMAKVLANRLTVWEPGGLVVWERLYNITLLWSNSHVRYHWGAADLNANKENLKWKKFSIEIADMSFLKLYINWKKTLNSALLNGDSTKYHPFVLCENGTVN